MRYRLVALSPHGGGGASMGHVRSTSIPRLGRLSAVGLIAATVGLLPGGVAAAGTAAAASTTGGGFRAPAYAGDFPDPTVLVVGGTYWAYATGSAGRNLQVTSSTDLQHWTAPVDPLPVLPPWAARGSTWAPSVVRAGATYVMWYTVRDAAAGRQCISVASSSTPQGPFTDRSSQPAICQLADGGSIDPNVYTTSTGQLDLIWKSDDNAVGLPTHLWGQPLAAGGLSLTGSPSRLLTQSAPWQSPSVEGPSIVAHRGTYYLFYGANSFASPASGIGYATSVSLLGPYADRSTSGPWLASRGNATGPQGPAVFTDASGVVRLAFAAWYGTVGYPQGMRAMWTAPLGFTRAGVPTLGCARETVFS
ncbi:MAG: glycoside hydrolase family 43 protein, partial [Acidimicrobiales bacterium]